MDINFHFYAVKAIAVLAGFNKPNANLIASFSQFVDDFKDNSALKLDNVPDYCAPLMEGDKFKPVQTGFGYVSTISTSTQKNVICPFHFIPPKSLRETGEDYLTKVATYHDKSIIDEIVKYAVNLCKTNQTEKNLIFLGAAIHVFADTYAHSFYSGFWASNNNVTISSAISNFGEKRSYKGYELLPAIGHACAGTAPDESDLHFHFTKHHQGGLYVDDHKNWEFFALCAVEILKYFVDVMRLEPSETLKSRVQICVENGCKIKGNNQVTLENHWKSADARLKNIPFVYDAKDLLKSMLTFNADTLPNGLSIDEIYEIMLAPNDETESINMFEEKRKMISEVSATASNKFYEFNYAAYVIRKAALEGKIE